MANPCPNTGTNSGGGLGPIFFPGGGGNSNGSSGGTWGSGGGTWGPGGGYNNGGSSPAGTSPNIPIEFQCPLFENRPHQALTSAIDELARVTNTSTTCRQQDPGSWDGVQKNTQDIQQAFVNIQSIVADPSALKTNPQAISAFEKSISQAILSVENLGQIFNNSGILQSQCGRESLTGGKVLLAINEVINSLAPYALMAAAANPAMGVAAKFAITGGAVATSSISTIFKMIENRTIDMSNDTNRKAVLVNTCQFTRIARKTRFMQLAQSGQIDRITSELESQLAAYQARYAQPSPELATLLSKLGESDRNTGVIDQQIRIDTQNLLMFESQIQEAGSDDLYVCLIAQEYVSRAGNAPFQYGTDNIELRSSPFPMSAYENLQQTAQYSELPENSLQLQSLILLNHASRDRLRALQQRSIDGDGGAIKICSDTAKTWVRSIRDIIKMTADLNNNERLVVEAELSKNPVYVAHRDQYAQLQAERATVNRLSKVMKELAKDNSVIDRSELDQKMALLKESLFGRVRSGWLAGKAPVEAWLSHSISIHKNAIQSFSDNVRRLQTAVFQLSNDPTASGNLDAINLTKVPIGTRGHEITCQLLESTWLDWAAGIDHLGATEFMCDMIDPYIDNKIDQDIGRICRGEIALDGKQLVDSQLQIIRKSLTKEYPDRPSYKKWAERVSKKLKEIQCPMPPTSVMN